jgi:hypothetical protein
VTLESPVPPRITERIPFHAGVNVCVEPELTIESEMFGSLEVANVWMVFTRPFNDVIPEPPPPAPQSTPVPDTTPEASTWRHCTSPVSPLNTIGPENVVVPENVASPDTESVEADTPPENVEFVMVAPEIFPLEIEVTVLPEGPEPELCPLPRGNVSIL